MFKKLPSGIVFLETGTIPTNNFQESLNKAIALFEPHKTLFQVVSLQPIVSYEQVMHALDQAIYFHSSGEGISEKLSIEFLLRLTAQRQITNALQAVQLPSIFKCSVCVIIYSSNKKSITRACAFLKKQFHFKADSTLFEKHVRKNFDFLKKFYSISDTELHTVDPKNKVHALKLLVLERVALLELNK